MACDADIFRDGKCLCCLMEQPGPMPNADLDAICKHLTELSGWRVRFDWHPQGGRPMVLYLGPHEEAVAAYLQGAEFMQARSNCYKKAFADKAIAEGNGGMLGDWTPSKLGTLDGPTIHEPNMVTIGQVWNRK